MYLAGGYIRGGTMIGQTKANTVGECRKYCNEYVNAGVTDRDDPMTCNCFELNTQKGECKIFRYKRGAWYGGGGDCEIKTESSHYTSGYRIYPPRGRYYG